MKILNVLNLGLYDYKKTLDIQKQILKMVQNKKMKHTLITVEHLDVFTLGKRGKKENIYLNDNELKDKKISVYEINRGGDVTYHGYGQLVIYPIFNLVDFGKDIRSFVEKLQNVIINNLLENHDIDAYKGNGKKTGVWVADKKITAIGIGVKKWVTYHGLAYNINTDLKKFDYINPCGLGKGKVTSLKELLGHTVDFKEEKENIIKYFVKEFKFKGINLLDKGDY